MQIIFETPDATADEVAAVSAALAALLVDGADDAPADTPAHAWGAAAALEAQGVTPRRGGRYRRWNAVERAGRAARWSSGIVGL